MQGKTDENPAKPCQIVPKLPFAFEPYHNLLNPAQERVLARPARSSLSRRRPSSGTRADAVCGCQGDSHHVFATVIRWSSARL